MTKPRLKEGVAAGKAGALVRDQHLEAILRRDREWRGSAVRRGGSVNELVEARRHSRNPKRLEEVAKRLEAAGNASGAANLYRLASTRSGDEADRSRLAQKAEGLESQLGKRDF